MGTLLAAAEPAPGWLRWIHLVGVVVYAGGLLTLTRFLGHAVAYRVLRRRYLLVGLPGLFLLVASGLTLLIWDPAHKGYLGRPYFHVKLGGVLVVLASDLVLMRKLFTLSPDGEQPRPALFKALHGVAALGVLAILAAVTIIRG
ncbi:MAG: hypothetical protein ACE5JG_04940 [Planctomycetota bacterium]